MTRVGLIGPAEREEVQRLAMRLEERSADAVILDVREDLALELDPAGERAGGVDLRGIAAFYVADLGLPPATAVNAAVAAAGDASTASKRDEAPGAAASERALRRSRARLSAWNALLERLGARARVVNPPRTHELHAQKPYEIELDRASGWPVPLTLCTSDAGELLAWPWSSRAGWVRKGMVGGYGYTEPLAPPTSLAAARALLDEHGPLLVQERVEGDNVRAFVVGGRVIGAAEILSASAADVDTRRGSIRVRRVALPPEAERVAVEAVARHGLAFSAVDFMREASSGRHVLLECNSSPFFVQYERVTGIDVSSALADHLLDRGERRRA